MKIAEDVPAVGSHLLYSLGFLTLHQPKEHISVSRREYNIMPGVNNRSSPLTFLHQAFQTDAVFLTSCSSLSPCPSYPSPSPSFSSFSLCVHRPAPPLHPLLPV